MIHCFFQIFHLTDMQPIAKKAEEKMDMSTRFNNFHIFKNDDFELLNLYFLLVWLCVVFVFVFVCIFMSFPLSWQIGLWYNTSVNPLFPDCPPLPISAKFKLSPISIVV